MQETYSHHYPQNQPSYSKLSPTTVKTTASPTAPRFQNLKLSSKSPVFTLPTSISGSQETKIFTFYPAMSPSSSIKPRGPVTEDDRKVYLSGIPKDMRKSKIKHCIQSQFGRVQEVKIIRHDQTHPCRYGFVTFTNVKNVQKCLAVEKLDIGGVTIYARKFKRKKNKMRAKRKKLAIAQPNYKVDQAPAPAGVQVGSQDQQAVPQRESASPECQRAGSARTTDGALDLVIRFSRRIKVFGRHSAKNVRLNYPEFHNGMSKLNSEQVTL